MGWNKYMKADKNKTNQLLLYKHFMAKEIEEFAKDGLVNLVGGCCGTTPDHIEAITQSVEGVSPRQIPSLQNHTKLSGLEPLTIRPESNFVNIGERTNVTGSSIFRKLIKNENYEKE